MSSKEGSHKILAWGNVTLRLERQIIYYYFLKVTAEKLLALQLATLPKLSCPAFGGRPTASSGGGCVWS